MKCPLNNLTKTSSSIPVVFCSLCGLCECLRADGGVVSVAGSLVGGGSWAAAAFSSSSHFHYSLSSTFNFFTPLTYSLLICGRSSGTIMSLPETREDSMGPS